jgi:hypothetical protein
MVDPQRVDSVSHGVFDVPDRDQLPEEGVHQRAESHRIGDRLRSGTSLAVPTRQGVT